MPHGHPHTGQGNRSLLASHGAGKGAADRTNNRAAFEKNFDEIDFHRQPRLPWDKPDGFSERGTKLVKKYGN